MKTDKTNVIRTTVSFNRAIHPEWFELLSSIENGRARAELVKSHLQLPDIERFKKLTKTKVESSPKKLPDPEKTSANEFSNSPSVLNSSTQNAPETAQTGALEKPNEFSKPMPVLNSSKNEPAAGGGLAGLLLGSGRAGADLKDRKV